MLLGKVSLLFIAEFENKIWPSGHTDGRQPFEIRQSESGGKKAKEAKGGWMDGCTKLTWDTVTPQH